MLDKYVKQNCDLIIGKPKKTAKQIWFMGFFLFLQIPKESQN